MNYTKAKIIRCTLMTGAAAVGLAGPGLTSSAQAQALQPVVDVCTGISLDDSVLTDVLNTTIVPTATGLETLYDNLLDIELNLGIGTIDLLDIPDVDLGIAATTAAIASGDTISLQVLDRDGNIVSPGDCNIAADGYTLNQEGGISIGGNQITGLGEDGMVATAGELDAIAFGNTASTAVGADGAVAIGTGATVTAAGVNSVALGAGSVADRGPTSGYTAPGLSGTFDSAGTVSVGDDGALRQITNVAPGTEASDAATVGQVQAAYDMIAAVDIGLDDAVTYDDGTHASVTLDGAGGTIVTGVADGAVNATSTDAVNGSQLFATNQQVDTNTGDIVALEGNVTTNADDIADLQETAVMYDDASQGSVTLGGAGGTTVTNIADGALNATSSDAVNGSQLFATNQQVDQNTGAITTLEGDVTTLEGDVTLIAGDLADLDVTVGANSNAIADLQETSVMYDDASQNSVTLGGSGGTTVTNVADGALNATSSDAVNGSQLFATNQQVDQNTVNIQANTDAIASISGSGGNPLAVVYDDASRESITLDGTDGTRIGNVADGDLSATSGDAVNGSQLFATNQQVDANTGAIGDIDNRVTVNEGDISNLDGRVTVNEGDIANLDGRVTVNEGDIASIDGRVTVNEGDIVALGDRVTTNEGDIVDLGDRVTTNEGDILAIDGRVTTNTQNIAMTDSRVSVIEGDLLDLGDTVTLVDARVTQNSGDIQIVQQQIANVPVGYVADGDPTMASDTPTNTAAFIGAGGDPVRVTNVAAGNVAAGSTDAVNGAQLAATNTAVAQNRVDIDRNSSDIASINNNLSGSTVAAVQYSNPDTPTQSNGGTITNDVTLVGADTAIPVALHNVAAGTAATDAVNLGQLQSGLNNVLANSMTYTDERFGVLADRIDGVAFDLEQYRDEAFAGTAGALAVAGIPQTIEAGRSMVGGAVGHYRGETAFAIGVSTTFSDGQGVIKAGGTVDTHGKGGFSAGAGISF